MQKPQTISRLRRVISLGQFFALPAIFLLGFIFTPAHAASIAQGYQTGDTELVVGMAAALSTDTETEGRAVERASLSNTYQFVGIVTTKDANFLTLTSNKANVVVATSGEVQTYVTDMNGTIQKGDKVTMSPILGVMMKANETDTQVFATALENFSETNAIRQNAAAYDGSGRQVLVNTMRVELNPRSVTAGNAEDDRTFLRVVGERLTGKALREWQVIVSLVIFILLLVVEAALIYGAVHSTISALGRNPLARDAVYKQLLQVVLVVLSLLAFGIATIYAILQI